MHLHSRVLRYLDEVAKAGSIRKAATSLHVTSSAINRRILLLEEQLGTQIFERHPSGLRLTAAGEVLIHHVRRTLQDQERAESELEELRGIRRGRVQIAAIEGAVELLAVALAEFHKQYPRITYGITIAPSAVIPVLVGSGDAHIGVSFNSPVTKGVRRIASATLEIGAVMRPDHPLAEKRTLRLADCARYPICLPGADVSVTRVLREAFAERKIEIEPLLLCNSVEAVKALVREGLGVTFKSALGLEREMRSEELAFRGLREPLNEKLQLLEQTGRNLPVAAAKLQEFLKKSIAAAAARLGKIG